MASGFVVFLLTGSGGGGGVLAISSKSEKSRFSKDAYVLSSLMNMENKSQANKENTARTMPSDFHTVAFFIQTKQRNTFVKLYFSEIQNEFPTFFLVRTYIIYIGAELSAHRFVAEHVRIRQVDCYVHRLVYVYDRERHDDGHYVEYYRPELILKRHALLKKITCVHFCQVDSFKFNKC